MKLLQLTINNFLSFKKANISLDDKGLVAVQGINLDSNGSDSNGSGKSSLFMAIRWCLYGKTDKNLAADEVINSSEKKNCFVTTHWLDEKTNIQYRITRYRSHSKHKDKLRIEYLNPGDAWKDNTKGKNSLTQEEVNKAIGMDDAVFIASCFASQEEALDIPAMRDTELKTLLEESLPLAKIAPVYARYKKKFDELSKILNVKEADLDKSENSVRIYKDILEKTEHEQSEYLANVEARKEVTKKKLEAVSKSLSSLKESDIDQDKLRASISALEAKKASLGLQDVPALRARVEGIQRQIDMLSEHEVKGDNCPTCSQPLPSDKIEALKQEAHDRMESLRVKLDAGTASLEAALANEPLARKIDDAIESLKEQLDGALSVEWEREGLETEQSLLKEKLEDMDIHPYASRIVETESEIKRLEAIIGQLSKEIGELKPELRVYSNLVDSLSPTGFRYHLLQSITPELNKNTNEYLAMLTDGKISAHWSTVKRLSSGDFKEAFSIKVNMNGRTNYGALSGGQKKKVRLACWFALQDMIAKRAEKDVKLWVCDEVDSALDKSGIERLMSLLEEKARTKETVLVISHNNLKDWIANSITVSMKDDISEVSGFLNVSD